MKKFHVSKIAVAALAMLMVLLVAMVGFAEGPEEAMLVESNVVVLNQEETAVAEEAKETDALQAAETHVVMLVNWNGEEIMSMDVKTGEKAVVPMFLSPMRDGHLFEHWTDVEAVVENEPFEFETLVEKDLVLMAYFTEIPVVTAAVEEVTEDTQEMVEEVAVVEEEAFAPEDTALDIIILDEDAMPLAGPAAVQTAHRSVNIYSNMGSCITENEVITLTGELVGFEGCDVTLQWQYDNGNGWTDVDGANGMTHAFAANMETVNSSWRLAVTVLN